MQLADLVALVKAQHWLATIALLTLIVRRWTAADSKFPVTIAPQWQPVVSAGGGLIYGFTAALQAGQPWGDALLAMAGAAGASGFLDGVLTAIFSRDNAPKWAKAIVFIFDDLTHGGGGGAPAQKAVSLKPQAPTPTTPVIKREGMSSGKATILWCWCFCSALFLSGSAVGCLPPGSSLPTDVGGAVACVIADLIAGKSIDDCIAQWGQALVNDAINILLDSKAFATEHPELVPKLQEHHAALARKIQ